jgi:ubiquinol-cytochrome c reductase cytochrome b subunit
VGLALVKPLEDPVAFVDRRTGAAPLLRKALRYLFPDHWSFLLGEVALYAFVVLIGTGVFLSLFFEPSLAKSTYEGSYAPLHGAEVSAAYRSAVDLSFDVKAGLLFRQTHHWAANVFVAAMVMHLLRVFFTGAYRRPRELTYLIGLAMLFTGLLEGYLGYSMIDDLLSGMGLAIGYGVALSIPGIGGNLALLIWGAPYPGDAAFESRLFIGHVFLFPAILAGLMGLHLALIAARHHTQFRSSPAATERTIVGVPTMPGQAPRSLALLSAVTAVLFALGGLVQINPIWLWGPYETALGTNGAQPDWYLGWLIGGLRLVPGFDVVIGGRTVVGNPFWGGVLFPLVVAGVLAAWPWLERGRGSHNVLARPRDAPFRTAFGLGFLSWVFLVFFAGSSDRFFVFLGVSYETQIWFWRFGSWLIPLAIGFATHRACRALQRLEAVDEERERAEREAVGRQPAG